MVLQVELEPQTVAAQRMYDPRAETYDDSWHPSYTERFCSLIPLRPGDKVLDLACGTGLDALMAAEMVGPEGEVMGVDISPSMLAQAEAKLGLAPCRTRLFQHDIADLDSLPELAEWQGDENGFDAIICSNAMFLFDSPSEVVQGWSKYLKKEGLLAVDVAHEKDAVALSVMSRVVARLGVDYPIVRSWLRSQHSMRNILEKAGYRMETEAEIDKVVGQRTVRLDVADAEAQFNSVTMHTRAAADFALTVKARDLFREEWEREIHTSGPGVELVNSMYIYVARKK